MKYYKSKIRVFQIKMTERIPTVICFTDKEPTPFQNTLVRKVTAMGLFPLVDSIHNSLHYESWFRKNFETIPSKGFYNDPYLMAGFMKDLKFNISGVPHFVVYFKDDDQVLDEEWALIFKYFNAKLNGVDELSISECVKAKEIFKLPTTGELLKSSENPSNSEDVVVTDADKYFYKFESRHFVDEDRMVCCITRPDNGTAYERPFTLVLTDFKENGYSKLFTDIYSSEDWGGNLDNTFMLQLWKELEMSGNFKPPLNPEKNTAHVFRSEIDDLFKVNEFGLKFFF